MATATTAQAKEAPMSVRTDVHVQANANAAKVLDVIYGLVQADFGNGVTPSPNFEAYEAAAQVVHATAIQAAQVVPVGTMLATADGPMIVAQEAHKDLVSREVTLTADGRPMVALWHEGPESGFESVMYERWTVVAGVLTDRAHGFIDPVSRKIVQVG